MTDEKPNAEQLRAQAAMLLTQARSQAANVQRALQSLGGDGVLNSELSAVAAQLSGAISDLEGAIQSPSFALRSVDLMAIQSIVQSGAVNAVLSQAAAQTSAQAAARTVATTAAETRTETQTIAHDIFDKKIFEKYLRFSSPHDEAAYRKREAEARKYIDAQLAKKSPEGDLNAGGGLIGEMLDQHAHGAGNSPDFLPRWNALVDKTTKQRAAMHAAGEKTEEFDRNLNTAVRRFLKAKGLSDAEIDARLAGKESPLEAVKPYIGDDVASHDLEHAAAASVGTPPVNASSVLAAATPMTVTPPPESAKIASIADSLKAAGVGMSPDNHTVAPKQALPGTPERQSPSLPS